MKKVPLKKCTKNHTRRHWGIFINQVTPRANTLMKLSTFVDPRRAMLEPYFVESIFTEKLWQIAWSVYAVADYHCMSRKVSERLREGKKTRDHICCFIYAYFPRDGRAHNKKATAQILWLRTFFYGFFVLQFGSNTRRDVVSQIELITTRDLIKYFCECVHASIPKIKLINDPRHFDYTKKYWDDKKHIFIQVECMYMIYLV